MGEGEEQMIRQTIAIRYMDENYDNLVPRLAPLPQGDWIDLAVPRDYFIAAHEYEQILFGVAMQLPDGYEAHIVPRSSTYRKYHIIQTNGIGIIDNSYRGNNDEWQMPVLATQNTLIPYGTRIAQFRIVPKMLMPNLTEVPYFEEGENRGGFGSTD